MEYNFITNINGCIESATQLMSGNLDLVYYSHIPVAIISILIGFFVINKNKSAISARSLFFLTVVFSLWVVCNLFAWVSSNSLAIMFFWSLIGMFDFLIFASCLFLLYTYETNKDVPFWLKIIVGLLFLPLLILTPTKFAITAFDYTYCMAIDNLFGGYLYLSLAFLSFIIIIVATIKCLKALKNNLKQIFLVSLGVILFLSTVFGTYYIADTLEKYSIEIYGVFAMTFFLAFLAYLIVKFKAFDIKLLGAQALVWALIILIGSQFFFIQNNINKILTGITLVISAITGIMIVRSVKKEVALREELEVANNNQQLLIRFITHQVKGFFTKSKMVFASILEGDMGEVSEPVKNIVKLGLESDNKAVDMVQEVLKASSLRSGQMTYNFEKVNMVDFVREIADGFQEMAVTKGLKYEVNLPMESMMVKIDKLQMTQVIKNLIDNSVKYTPTGEVVVNLKLDNSKLLFTVKDNGIGLSEADKVKLFTEGGRGEESVKVNVQSTGYGLYIVKKIVEGHGGRIWAESAGRGHGSKFCVEIPSL